MLPGGLFVSLRETLRTWFRQRTCAHVVVCSRNPDPAIRQRLETHCYKCGKRVITAPKLHHDFRYSAFKNWVCARCGKRAADLPAGWECEGRQ